MRPLATIIIFFFMAKEQSLNDILRDVRAHQFKPVYILMGAEPYYIDLLHSEIVNNAVPEAERDFCVQTFYGPDTTANAVINAARSFPMGSRMLVVVREAQDLPQVEEIAFYLQNPQPSSVLVLENRSGNFDRRKKFMTLAAQRGVVFESPKVRDNNLPPLIAAYFRDKGLRIDNKSVSIIAESVGTDLTRLYSALDKLAASLPEGQTIVSPDIVERIIGVSKDFNIFEYLNALTVKDVFKAFQIAKYFDENPKQNPIQMILPSLFRQFAQLMMAYYSPARDKNGIAQYIGMQPWQVERNILPAMRNYSARKVLAILSAIRDTDEKSKGYGGSKVAPGDLLKELTFFILH